MKRILLYTCYIFILLIGCKNSNLNYSSIVGEWQNKVISFPISSLIKAQSKQKEWKVKSPYKIIRHVDSTDCTICDLLLPQWNEFYEQLDSIPIFFFIHINQYKEISHRIKLENNNMNIYFDIKDSLNLLNKFPDDKRLQTFLVDSNNRIKIIGDPILNREIRKLYLKTIFHNSN